MTLIKHVLFTILYISIAGCISPKVVTNTTAFYVPTFNMAGTIAVLPSEKPVQNTLEFAHYRSLIEKQLTLQGYSIQTDPEQSEYIAFVSFGIDNGKPTTVVTPVIGQTSGGYTYNTGTYISPDGPKTYTYTGYRMPTYGVVSSTTRTQTDYTRAIALDIVEAKSMQKQGKPVKVYEGRAKSTGSCSEIAAVFDVMLDALFKDFPGENGKVRVIKVNSETSC